MSITVNPWQKFRKLLPSGSRTYGTIDTVNATAGTSRVTLQGGSQITVKGTDYAPGDRVLVADGEIRQKVPALTFVNITLY